MFHSTFRWNCSLPKFLERPILISLKFVLFYLFVSTLLLHLLFGFQWTLSLSGFFPWKLFFCDSLSLVGTSGLEPPTSRLSGARSNHLSYAPLWLLAILFPSVLTGGDDGIRTHDPLLAGQVLSQLSYTPIFMRLFSGHWKLNNNQYALRIVQPKSRHRFDLFAIRHTRENVSVSP